MSTEQQENLEAVLRRSPIPAGSSVSEQRRRLRERASARPAAFVMSPYADLTLAGATMDTKSDVDPLLSRELLQPRIADYTAGQDPALGLISPVFADLSGLPPLIIQAGTHEVLLDDAVRLAQKAAAADVAVTLDLTPKVPHVFQNFYPILDEAADALDRAGKLLTAYLERRNTCEQQ